MFVAWETYGVIFENDYFEIGQDTELQAVVLTYKRQGTSEEFREVHYQLLRAFEKTRQARLLVDAREMGVVAPDDQRWVGQHIVPQLTVHTLDKYLYIATIVAEGVFTKLAIDNIERISVGTGLCQNKSFDSVTAGKVWLLETKKLLL